MSMSIFDYAQALEQGPTERPDDDPDEGEVSSVEKELEPRVASLELNKKLDVYRCTRWKLQ